MLSSLAARDRRALLLGAASIAGLLLVGRGLPAWRRWQSHAMEAARYAAAAAERHRVLARSARAIHDSLVVREGRLVALSHAWLTGDSPAAAGADLAAFITRAATDAAMTLGAVDLRTDSVGPMPLVRVHVRLSVTGDVEGLATFLAALDGGPCALSVRSIDIQGGEPAADPHKAEVLRADLEIDALWRHAPGTGGAQ